ncbi:hypothetical protein LG401_11620 [Bacillus pumilus]|uniref:hypothetical protein n=1 Tax=Bacillus pumilus TaxID=1408 RepID=UPI001CFBE5DB|nr:hypothetical protein [Bacillus pumilus]UCZ69713.1 hypothetical protein LG401_11620 [Bacillus pumilus]
MSEYSIVNAGDAEEFTALRLEALRLHPEGFAMSYEEEQIDTKDKYAARFTSAQSMWTFGTFYGAACGDGHAHPRNLTEIKAPSECSSDVCNGWCPRKGSRQVLMTEALSFARERQDIEQMY